MGKIFIAKLRENIVEDFYLTPDYFEKELNTKYGSGFSIQPKFSNLLILGSTINLKYTMDYILVMERTQELVQVLSSAKVLDKIL